MAEIFGFRSANTVSGIPSQDVKVFVPSTDSTAIYLGDAVVSVATTDNYTNEQLGVPTVTASTASTDVIRGVCQSVDLLAKGNTNPYLQAGVNYRAASTAQYIHINQDPMSEWLISAVSTGLANTSSHKFAPIKYTTAGSTSTGYSGMQLDDGNLGTSGSASTAQLKIVDMMSDFNANHGITAFATAGYIVKVRINIHEFNLAVPGV